MIKNYKKYSDIPKKYRFDLDDILGNKTIENLMEELQKKFKESIKTKDSRYESETAFLKSLKHDDETELLLNKIQNYISNNLNINIVDPKFNKLNSEVDVMQSNFLAEFGSESNRLFKHQLKIKEWIKNDKFAHYRKNLEAFFESKKYKLDDKIEDFLAQTTRANVDQYSTFSILSNSELDFGHVVKGKTKIPVSLSNLTELKKSKNENIRKTATENYINGHYKHRQSFSNLLHDHLKKRSTFALHRGHKSLLEAEIYEDRIEPRLLENLYASVKKAAPIFDKYTTYYKKFFKSRYKKEYKLWDSELPIVNVNTKYSVEEAEKLVEKALEPMGKEYLSVVKSAFKNRWIDYIPVKNKRSGAYSIGGSYGLDKKYILMNFDGSLGSVGTLAHEMGHSMHSYYSDTNLPISQASYPIFLAEIASIFNELMLSDYLVKKSKDKKMQFYLLNESITDFMGTVRRQAMWSSYETKIYEAIDKGVPLSSFESFENIYVENAKEFHTAPFAKKITLGKKHNVYAVTVPHYYYSFYMYKYAVGYIVANVFFTKYKNEGKKELENYITKFLSAGGKDWPALLLKEAGIDLYDPKIYEQAFTLLNDKVEQFVKLGKEIFKVK